MNYKKTVLAIRAIKGMVKELADLVFMLATITVSAAAAMAVIKLLIDFFIG